MLILSATELKLIGFYLVIFIVAYFIKKSRQTKIAINSIWFSTNGLVPQDAIDNLINLAHAIKNSPFKKNYKIYFWTDARILDSFVRKTLKKSNIIIKHYRDVVTSDSLDLQTMDQIEQLLKLANGDNKLFFVLASDLFRLYLLLREFPLRYKNNYTCYFDCNDIQFNSIPEPALFRKIKSIAFHFVEFSFFEHNIFSKLVNCSNQYQLLLTNDVIITVNKNITCFKKLFESYCNNFFSLNKSRNGINEFLKMTCKYMPILDDDLVRIIIFTTTHMVNTLYLHAENNDANLLTFANDVLMKKESFEVQDVVSVINFERHYHKGFTCLQRDNVQVVDSVMTEEAILHRQRWYHLFINRYLEIHCVEQPKINNLY